MKIYLSHPYGGRVVNRDHADAIAQFFTDIFADEGSDNEIVNPLDLLKDCAGVLDEKAITNAAIELMRGCDAVLFCPGWQKSRGCNKELHYAQLDGLIIEFLPQEIADLAWDTYYGIDQEDSYTARAIYAGRREAIA